MLNVSFRVSHNTHYKISLHLFNRFAVNRNPRTVHAKLSSVGQLIVIIMIDYCSSIAKPATSTSSCASQKTQCISIIKINNGVRFRKFA